MQQAILAEGPANTVVATTAPTAPNSSNASAATPVSGNSFVINLVSSTTPVALTRPDHAGLNRFTFFVSRRREDGRERFRLHMGYFDTQEQAEKLLDIVRTIYPGAWAGLAPGRRLAGGAGAATPPAPVGLSTQGALDVSKVTDASSEKAARGASTAPAPAPTPVAASAPVPVPTPVAASASIASAQPAVSAAPAASMRAAARTPPRPVEAPTLSLIPDEGRRVRGDFTEEQERFAAARSLSNIRETIAALDDGAAAENPAMGTLPATTAATAVPTAVPTAPAAAATIGLIPELAGVVVPTVHPPPSASASRRTAQAGEIDASLTDSGVLRLLEGTAIQPAMASSAPANAAETRSAGGAQRQASAARRPSRSPSSAPESQRSELSRSESLGSKSLGTESQRTDKPYYAVQLMWSVQPIAMAQIPQLAIFSAYTLYGAEGNRDGRRWYGLRLGFFTDAVSAKQVAHYVRADFATVSVVPVTIREREQALQTMGRAPSSIGLAASPGGVSASHLAAFGAAGAVNAVRPTSAAGAIKPLSGKAKKSEFEFIDDREPVTVRSVTADGANASIPPRAATRPIGSAGGARPTRGAPGKRAKVRPPGQIHARAKAKPKTLEETLEILGANELRVDDEPGASINDSGVRHLRVEPSKAKHSKLSRLFERLSERLGD